MRREIENLKICQNTNIVQLIDLFETSTDYQIVMELMEGADMFDYMENRKFKLKESHIKQIVIQLLMGVQYFHSYGIVHRDLKLENIMMSDMSDDAVPKIADFGLSKILGPNETARDAFGTVGYAAPEVLLK